MATPSANYTAERDAFGRTIQYVVEVDMDICDNDYTSAPCTAADAGDGARCFYSYPTCQDRNNLVKTTRTYRFCMADRPLPYRGEVLYPYIREIDHLTQKIDPKKAITHTERFRVSFYEDHDPPPFDLDKTGLTNTARTGSFGRRFLQIHKNYPGREMRIKRGFVGIALADFLLVATMKVRQMGVDGPGWFIECEHLLADLTKVSTPRQISEGNIVEDTGGINDSVTTINVTDGSEFTDPADLADFSTIGQAAPSGFNWGLGKVVVEVGDSSGFDGDTNAPEYCIVTSISGNALTVTRGRFGTTAVAHEASAKIREVTIWKHENTTPASAATGANAIDCILDLLNRAGIGTADIDTTEWEAVRDNYWSDVEFSRILTDHKKIAELMKSARLLLGLAVYLDEDYKVSCKTIAPPTPGSTLTELTDTDNLIAGTVAVEDDDEARLTRAIVHWDPSEENAGKNVAKYQKHLIRVDTDLEGANNYNDERELEVFSSWIDPAEDTATIATLTRRLISRFREGLRLLRFAVELKDFDLVVGDFFYATTPRVQDEFGASEKRLYFVTERQDIRTNEARFEALDTKLLGNYLFWAPSSLDGTNWKDASVDNQQYGCFGRASDNTVELSSGARRFGFVFW